MKEDNLPVRVIEHCGEPYISFFDVQEELRRLGAAEYPGMENDLRLLLKAGRNRKHSTGRILAIIISWYLKMVSGLESNTNHLN